MDLPNEMTSHIFSFLPMKDIIESTRFVCIQFNIFSIEEEKKRKPEEVLDMIREWFPEVPNQRHKFIISELKKLDRILKKFNDTRFFCGSFINFKSLRKFVVSVRESVNELHFDNEKHPGFAAPSNNKKNFFDFCNRELKIPQKDMNGIFIVLFSLIPQREKDFALYAWVKRCNTSICKCALICGADKDAKVLFEFGQETTARKEALFTNFKPIKELF